MSSSLDKSIETETVSNAFDKFKNIPKHLKPLSSLSTTALLKFVTASSVDMPDMKQKWLLEMMEKLVRYYVKQLLSTLSKILDNALNTEISL